MKYALLRFSLVFCPCFLLGQRTLTVNAPNQAIALQVTHAANGQLRYAVQFKGSKVILPSGLGFSLVKPKVQLDRFKIIQVDSSAHDSRWKPVWATLVKVVNGV